MKKIQLQASLHFDEIYPFSCLQKQVVQQQSFGRIGKHKSACMFVLPDGDALDIEHLSPAVGQIMTLGTEIGDLLTGFVNSGKEQGIVRQEIIPMPTIYILRADITSLLTLVSTKGAYIAKAFSPLTTNT